MRFLVLGPLEVTEEGGEPVPIAGAKERTILADLISHAGHVVSIDDLLEEVWGEDPPRTAEKTLGSYVSRLRRALEPGRSARATSDVIETRGGGYVLDVSDDQIDAIRFERLAADGRRLLDAGRHQDAGSVLDAALDLWRGAAYQDYRYTGFGTTEGERLEELRRSAREDRVDTRLAGGDASTVIPELEAMVRDEPLRERRWGQLMLALYQAGRQAEALQAFARARIVLVDELGIEPGPDLQRMQVAILGQDPVLERRWPRAAEPLSSTDVCPYKGLARFETSDAEFYFGREQLVAEAVGRLVGGRFLGLIGASGSGKSSLMRAGLLHAIGSGALPGSDGWTVSVVRPGEHPLESFNAALATSGSPTRMVLAVDQFEEAFTTCGDDAERIAFFDALAGAALVPDGAVTVVLAMRSDYYGRCADHRALASLLAASQILVGTMNEAELRRAIELPAEHAGLTVDHQLSDALVADSVGQPGGLPLLSTALLELWTHRRDRTLHLDDYLRPGGLQGAVARLAEDALGRLDRDGQASAKRILLRLADSGDGRDVVSRRAPLTEFDLDRDGDARRALTALTDARLVTVAEGTVEVAHEALLRDWPRLRAWLEDDAEGRRLHRHVTSSASAWEEGGRDQGDLYRGARLAAAVDWADAHDTDLNTEEREFLSSSRAASEGENLQARRTNRRLRGLLVGVALLLAVSLVVGNLALGQRDDARAAADVADARQLAGRSLAEGDDTLALLLAREAVGLDDSVETRSALLAALQRDPAVIAVMHPDGAPREDLTEWLRLSPDGQTIATGGARTTVDLFDATTYQPIGMVDVGADTTTGAFVADGRTLVVADVDRELVEIDVDGPAVERRIPTKGKEIDSILLAPGGQPLLTAESSHGRGFLVTRDPATLEPSGARVPSRSGSITAMAFSSDGDRLVTTSLPPEASGERETVLWDASQLVSLRTFPGIGGNDVALSPDGQTAAIAAATQSNHAEDDGLKGHLMLLNLQTGEPRISEEGRAPHNQGPPIGLTGVAFSPDGGSVVSTGDDQRVLIWDASSPVIRIEEAFNDPAHLDVRTPTVSQDGSTVYTIDADGNVVVWDLKGDRSLGRSFRAGSGAVLASGLNGLPWFALSSDGSRLAIVQYSPNGSRGTVRLVDASSLEATGTIHYNLYAKGYPHAVAFSPDGRTLAVTSVGGYVQLWDVDTDTPEGPPFRSPKTRDMDLWSAAFSPDGTLLATGGDAGDYPARAAFLWNVSTGRLIGRLPPQHGSTSSLNFSPDGALLVDSTGWVGSVGDAIVWSVGEREVKLRIPVNGSGITWADISNDGTRLVTAGASEREWDLSTGESLGSAFNGPEANSVDLSRDGQLLVTAGQGQVALWDVATRTVLGGSFPGPRAGDQLAAAFTPDGQRLFVVSATGEGWVWNVDPGSWDARACQMAGRPLTEAEWQVNLPDRPYDPTCIS